ncbi:flagellar basal-body MS-ring/collar protein FliF [Aestuariivirga sp.]|uniref:flagellar basal-body MS-ring/collar protein FliF n=1 Tax=Aestuariivirga sp. TaxID=2650926 RepID=UPI0039E2C3F5
MAALVFFKRLGEGLTALGVRRLVALGLAGITVFVLVGVCGYYLSRPSRDVLYSGLDPQDVTRIGSVLDDAGISFDVNVSGNTVLVDYGNTAKARMLLAQKGLPKSGSAGYELFDKLGSLGLTSFMQQVTRVRALEGELARTIQDIDGIKAARVHLALRNDSSFRDKREAPTASVLIRMEGGEPQAAALAIRHLVAAAIPGLTPDQVSVMSTDGTLLASGEDALSAAPEKMMGLERSVAADLQQKLERTLAPYLGLDNVRISVVAKLNADRKQISETDFDPNSRVERSVRTVKESGEAQNSNGAQPVSVEQNIPREVKPEAGGDASREKKDHREEITNYEINSKQTATTTDGYGIDQLSVAIVVNRAQIVKALGGTASAEQLVAQTSDIEQLAISAAGLNTARGDHIKVSAVDFIAGADLLAPVESEGLLPRLMAQSGALINAAALIAVSLLVVFLGLRPALRSILAAAPLKGPEAGAIPVLPDSQPAPLLERAPGDPLLDDLTRQSAHAPQNRLGKIVELDPDRAAMVLKQWLSAPDQRPA